MPKHVFSQEKFRKTFAMIVQVKSLIVKRKNILTMTGTATKNTFDIILQRLEIWEPVCHVMGLTSS